MNEKCRKIVEDEFNNRLHEITGLNGKLADIISTEDECEHQYREIETAPLGVVCIHCGHFVGAWE